MKKVIAIMMVLAVIVGFAFAADTHTLTVKTVVDDIAPSFQLRYSTNGAYTNKTADGNNIQNQTYYGQYDAENAHTYGDTSNQGAAINLQQDIAKQDVVANFYAVLCIGAKQLNKSYTLSFSAGSFNTEHNSVLEATACSESSINKVVAAEKANVVVTNAETNVELSEGATKSCTITLKGAPAEEAIDLVVFQAKWPRKKDADAGEYTADVTLTITLNQ